MSRRVTTLPRKGVPSPRYRLRCHRKRDGKHRPGHPLQPDRIAEPAHERAGRPTLRRLSMYNKKRLRPRACFTSTVAFNPIVAGFDIR